MLDADMCLGTLSLSGRFLIAEVQPMGCETVLCYSKVLGVECLASGVGLKRNQKGR